MLIALDKSNYKNINHMHQDTQKQQVSKRSCSNTHLSNKDGLIQKKSLLRFTESVIVGNEQQKLFISLPDYSFKPRLKPQQPYPWGADSTQKLSKEMCDVYSQYSKQQ